MMNHYRPQLRASAWAASIAAAVAALSLAGCVNYSGIKSDKQIEPPAKFETKQSLPAEGGQWPAMDWAKQFGDPQLPALIEEALQANPTIDQARARIEKASSYVGSANSTLYPNVTGSYAWTRQLYTGNGIVPPPYNGTWQSENNVLASASFDLDLWGKNREKLRQAVSQEKVADAEAEEVRISLAASVASTYNHLAQLYALRDIEVREVKNREDIGHITDGRVGAGLDTNVERQTALAKPRRAAPASATSTDRSRPYATNWAPCSARARPRPQDRQSVAWRGRQRRTSRQPSRRPAFASPRHRCGLLAGGCRHSRHEGSEG